MLFGSSNFIAGVLHIGRYLRDECLEHRSQLMEYGSVLALSRHSLVMPLG